MVPQFGFGGAPLGDLFTKVTESEADSTLSAAWDAGVRYYDTAPWYGRGQSEHRIGRALYHRPRKEVVLSTKVGRILKAPANPETFDTGMWAGGLPFDIEWNYSYDGIMRVLRGQPSAPRHDPHRHPHHPRSRLVASQDRRQGQRLSRPARRRAASARWRN